MGTAALVARLLLAAVFVVAAIGKLLDLPGSRKALEDFGVPAPLARPGGALLPIAELATATALLIQPSAQWGSVAALVLLAGFIAGISRALARGEAPDCHCFGAIQSEPAGPKQLVRNGALGILAIIVLAGGPGSAINDWSSSHGTPQGAVAAIALAAVALLAIAAHLWMENRRLRSEMAEAHEVIRAIPPGLPVGSLAPSFSVADGAGRTLALDDLRSAGQPVVLVFVRPGCGPCTALLEELVHWRDVLSSRLSIGIVGLSQLERFVDQATRLAASLTEVMERDKELSAETDEVHKVLESYRVHATPSAVVVTPEGTIASATVDGRLAIEALIRLTLAGRGASGINTRRVAA